MKSDDTPEDLLYAMRRNLARQVFDGELIDVIFRLRNCLRSLRENGTKMFNLQDKYPLLDELGGEDLLEIAVMETENALRPFQDEWNDRHKN